MRPIRIVYGFALTLYDAMTFGNSHLSPVLDEEPGSIAPPDPPDLILCTQYTLSDNMLRVQAQLSQMVPAARAELCVQSRGSGSSVWKGVETMHALARTVPFAVSRCVGVPYRVYQVRMVCLSVSFSWRGVVRAESVAKRKMCIPAFPGYEVYLFLLQTTVLQALRHNVNVLFFPGDQIYETARGDTGSSASSPHMSHCGMVCGGVTSSAGRVATPCATGPASSSLTTTTFSR